MDDMREMVTPEELARQLRLNTVTIYRYIREKKLPAFKIGRSYRIARPDIDAFLDHRRTTVEG